MLARVLLKTSLLLGLVQLTLQGGVRRPAGTLGRLAPTLRRGTGVLGSRVYAGTPGKTGAGQYLGGLGYPSRAGPKPGYGAALGGYGGSLGARPGLGNGWGGPGYTNGYRYQPGYSFGPGMYQGAGLTNGYGADSYPQTGRRGKLSGLGYNLASDLGTGLGGGLGAGLGGGLRTGPGGGLGGGLRTGPGAGLGAGLGGGLGGGLGTGLGPYLTAEINSKYGGARPGAVIDTAAGQPMVSPGFAGTAGGYGEAPYMGQPGGLGVDTGLGGARPGAVIDTAAGQPMVSPGFAGKAGGYGEAPYMGQPGGLGVDTGLGTGRILEPVTAGQLPYNGALLAPAKLDGDNGYRYETQQLSLGGNGGKLPYGNGAVLGAGGQGPYGAVGKDGSQYGAAGYYGNGIKG